MRAILLMLLLLAGCSASEPLPRDPVQAKAQIAALIPDGTSVDAAKQTLEEKGLSCRLQEVQRPQPKTYLYATADRATTSPVSRHWLVRFDVRDGRVYAPWVGVQLTGP